MPGQFYVAVVAVSFFCWLAAVIYAYSCSPQADKGIAILLQDQAEEVEGFIRSIIKKHHTGNLVLVDTGSSDETAEILKRMAQRFGMIFIEDRKGSCPGQLHCFDARNFHGKDLINLEFFKQFLS